MTQADLLRKSAETPEVEPDAEDLAMMKMAAEQDEAERSGRIMLRIPRSLRGELIKAARREGVSLNQYCLYRLAGR